MGYLSKSYTMFPLDWKGKARSLPGQCGNLHRDTKSIFDFAFPIFDAIWISEAISDRVLDLVLVGVLFWRGLPAINMGNDLKQRCLATRLSAISRGNQRTTQRLGYCGAIPRRCDEELSSL